MIYLIEAGVLPQTKAIRVLRVMHIFLNFLTLSVCLDCLFVSVAVQLSQWQLVIHFSSATRRVLCVLIRANSLVGLTHVSLKH